jgi:hypothetical protein
MTREELTTHLKDQLQKHLDKRQFLCSNMERAHHNRVPALGTKEYGDYLVLEGAIMRETSYIEWLEKALAREA